MLTDHDELDAAAAMLTDLPDVAVSGPAGTTADPSVKAKAAAGTPEQGRSSAKRPKSWTLKQRRGRPVSKTEPASDSQAAAIAALNVSLSSLCLLLCVSREPCCQLATSTRMHEDHLASLRLSTELSAEKLLLPETLSRSRCPRLS